MKIFIIGKGGVGKSTCGEILANLPGYNFIDLDVEFCKRVENVGAYNGNKVFSHEKPEIIAEQMKKEIAFYNKEKN